MATMEEIQLKADETKRIKGEALEKVCKELLERIGGSLDLMKKMEISTITPDQAEKIFKDIIGGVFEKHLYLLR